MTRASRHRWRDWLACCWRVAARAAVGRALSRAGARAGALPRRRTLQLRGAARRSARAPDPRCGETLDGRAARPPRRVAVAAGRCCCRRSARVARSFWPVVEAAELIETTTSSGWMDALLTSDDGLVGVRPSFNYSTGFLPTFGARLFYRRCRGAGSEVARASRPAGRGCCSASCELQAGPAGAARCARPGTGATIGCSPGSARTARPTLAARGAGLARYGSDIVSAELRWSRRLPLHLVADAARRRPAARLPRRPACAAVRPCRPLRAAAAACAAAGLRRPVRRSGAVPGFDAGAADRARRRGARAGLARAARATAAVSACASTARTARGSAGDPSRTFVAGRGRRRGSAAPRQLLLRGPRRDGRAGSARAPSLRGAVSPSRAGSDARLPRRPVPRRERRRRDGRVPLVHRLQPGRLSVHRRRHGGGARFAGLDSGPLFPTSAGVFAGFTRPLTTGRRRCLTGCRSHTHPGGLSIDVLRGRLLRRR